MNLETTVNWPTIDHDEPNGWSITGENGLQVFAIWGSPDADSPARAYLHMGEVFTGAEGELHDRLVAFNREAMRNQMWGSGPTDWNFPLSTAVLLGATFSSYFNENWGEYFSVTRGDLTEEGEAILAGFEAIYGERATLVTFLDT